MFCCDLGCLAPCFAGRRGGGVLFAEDFFRIGFFIGSFRRNSGSIVGEYRSCQGRRLRLAKSPKLTGVASMPVQQSRCVSLSNEIGALFAGHGRPPVPSSADTCLNTPVRVRNCTEVMQKKEATIGRNVATNADGSHALPSSLFHKPIRPAITPELARNVYNTVPRTEHPSDLTQLQFLDQRKS